MFRAILEHFWSAAASALALSQTCRFATSLPNEMWRCGRDSPHFLGYALCAATVAVSGGPTADDRGTSSILRFVKVAVSICNLTWQSHFELSDATVLSSN